MGSTIEFAPSIEGSTGNIGLSSKATPCLSEDSATAGAFRKAKGGALPCVKGGKIGQRLISQSSTLRS
jgi:hypothetical protein